MKQVLLTALVAGLVALGVVKMAGPAAGGAVAAPKESAYERVMRTGVLRCGYGIWDGGLMKPSGSGELTGAWVDIMAELAKLSELKVEWVAEIGWGSVAEALNTGKIDAMCAGMWESGIKAKHMGFTRPLYYQTIEGFVRADDTRFDGNVLAANAPAVTLAVLDNDASGFIAASDFPQAKLMPLSHMQGDAELLMSVASGKADMTFTAPGLFRSFDKANPGKLKPAAKGSHLRAFGGAITVRADDSRLRHMLDVAIAEAMGSGAVDRILAAWNARYPEMFVPIVRGF